MTKSIVIFETVHSAGPTLLGIELYRTLKKDLYDAAINSHLFERLYAFAIQLCSQKNHFQFFKKLTTQSFYFLQFRLIGYHLIFIHNQVGRANEY